MYTFIILAVLMFILSGAIFGKRIKENQLTVAMIVFAGTFIGSVIVNGILGSDIPYTLTKIKTKELSVKTSFVQVESDTLFHEFSRIKYKYVMEIEKDGDTSLTNYIDIGGFYDEFYSSSSLRKLYFHFLPEEDSTATDYVDIFRYKKLPNNRWVSKMGLPGGGREFHVYIKDNENNQLLMDQINEKFYGIEKPAVAIIENDSTTQYVDVIPEN